MQINNQVNNNRPSGLASHPRAVPGLATGATEALQERLEMAEQSAPAEGLGTGEDFGHCCARGVL